VHLTVLRRQQNLLADQYVKIMLQAALGSQDEEICVERGGPPKAPVFGGANPASVPSHIKHQVTDCLPWMQHIHSRL